MCGICGEITFDGSPASPHITERMTDCLIPRGPDSGGMLNRGRVSFGHRRLKIIDLSDKAEQPMVDSELGLSIAFNGCIYNYPELREELQGMGYRFFSHGDTEVILKAYHAWGLDFVQRFNGMFAFAIHERDTGRVILGRDRFGIKPLYLAEQGKRLFFASSLPAIVATGEVDTTIDPVALQFYMSFHAVVPAPYTMLKGVRKLPPATLRVIEKDGTSRDIQFWKLNYGGSAEGRRASLRGMARHGARRVASRGQAPHGRRCPRGRAAFRRCRFERDCRASGRAGSEGPQDLLHRF